MQNACIRRATGAGTRHAAARSRGRMSASTAAAPTIRQLQAVPLTPEAFAPFGQVIEPTHDGKEFDDQDAQLVLDKGQPRFYIMRIPRRGLAFSRITFHADVTQCLGGLQPRPWYLVVAAPSGSVAAHPQQQDLVAFRIEHGQAVKMHKGTWHAGPLFDGPDGCYMDFYNLELSDTNLVDHNTHDYATQGLQYQVVDKDSSS